MPGRTLLDLLESRGVITSEEARSAREEARKTNKDIEAVLIDKKGIKEAEILKAKSEMLGIPSRDLLGKKVAFDVLKYIPEEAALNYQFVPLGIANGVLEIGMVSPESIEAREALQFISSSTNLPFRVFLISRSDFKSILGEYGGLRGEVTKALSELESAAKEGGASYPKLEEAALLREDAPITKTVAVMLRHAIEGKASDIHIEPGKDQLRVRFRVDGVLYTSLYLPITVHEAIISRVKIMSSLKIDERRVPQDGRFRANIDGRDIDFRISTFPTYFGEKVAIRILDPEEGVKELPALGLEGRNLAIVKENLKKPYGLIVITGPTGSGKSTTLYAMLRILNNEKRNIVSLEDPVEYYIEGLNQSQVRPEIGYTFANGIRQILRQDPDIIMVGEIRDKETAQLAIHAALTGHLVLSTLHTNDALGVIPRLVDMGVDPFLIPAALNLALAQRLVRTLCPDSKKEIPVTAKLKASLEEGLGDLSEDIKKKLTIPKKIYDALPSPSCPKGTKGRIAIFEVLSMTPELERIILKEPSESAILEEAKRQGIITMRQDGYMKVLDGKIGLEALIEIGI